MPQLRALTPMGRRERIGKLSVACRKPKMPRLTHIAVSQQFFEEATAAHAVRWRAEHGDQLRAGLRRREHFPALAQIHRHTRLAEDVFAGLQR
jgi:hypothetical protein